MPYSNVLMMVILSLQLWALYLIIFLHKQLMAIGLVMVSLLLSAVIVALSRKHNKSQQEEFQISDDIIESISALFNQINQRHYQIHGNIEQLHHSLNASKASHQSSARNLQTLSTKFKSTIENNQALADDEAGVSQQEYTKQFATLNQFVRDCRKQLDANQRAEIKAITSLKRDLVTITEHVHDTERLADELKLKTLNASIEAGRASVKKTDFSNVAAELSKVVRQLENNKNTIQSHLESLITESKTRKMEVRSQPVIDLPHEFAISSIDAFAETTRKVNVPNKDISDVNEIMSSIEAAISGNIEFEKQLLSTSNAITGIDKDYKEIKEYFIECMIHLDELKQGLLTPEEFHKTLDKTNQMITEMYDSETTTKLTNDVLR